MVVPAERGEAGRAHSSPPQRAHQQKRECSKLSEIWGGVPSKGRPDAHLTAGMRATANPLTGRSGATPDVELVVQRAGEHNAQEVGLQQRGHDVVRGGLLAACAPHGGEGQGPI